ncbi:STAS domain-containing protein [Insolitispirillum peregrinum]|uniref:STAS domain-containing protein n=1 Tax=Insolitispirillum peregrinum TaxID=80876 RepID=A0A1N7QBQ2_9PROT|nr:STAS domain-containing protein [Insolitispirillum peregrinum]SIT20206.1 STAS domain-containing protein [Insolitispirillum peregrinum]
MVEINRSGTEIRLTFDRRQTLAEAEQTKDHLMAALSAGDVQTVWLDCMPTDEMDISFLQLLLAARKMGQARGIAVSLTAPATDALADTLARAGLARPGDGGKGWFDSFWAGGQG